MNVHCQFCRNSFNLGRDYIAEAVKEADEKRQKYHAVECPKCRKTIKVSVKQMRRYVPKSDDSEEDE
jgi:hypothetical protein